MVKLQIAAIIAALAFGEYMEPGLGLVMGACICGVALILWIAHLTDNDQ